MLRLRQKQSILALVLVMVLLLSMVAMAAEEGFKVKLGLFPRLVCLSLLPENGSYATLKIVRELQMELAPTEEESKLAGIKDDLGSGGVTATLGWDKVLEKYPNSYLYIKINPIYGIDQGHNALLEKLQHMKNVAIITQQLSDEQMKELFTKVDCYVSPHLSEGFGMQMLEAMATETPIICSSWSGNMDFCNKRNAYLIKSRGKIAVNEYIYQDIEWQLPDERDFLLKMIEVQQNHKKRKKIIKEGLKTAQQYSWKKIGKQLEKYLQSVK